MALYDMQHGSGILSGVLCDFQDLFHGWLHTVTSQKQAPGFQLSWWFLKSNCYGTCLRGCGWLFWNVFQELTVEWAQIR